MTMDHTSSSVDPLTFAVVAGGLDSIVREMTITMVKTSRSPVLTEGYDFSNSLFDGRQRMVMQGHNIPVHVGAMIDAGKAMAEYFGGDIFDGDVMYCNDPAFEGSHLPDMTMYKPVFFEHENEGVFMLSLPSVLRCYSEWCYLLPRLRLGQKATLAAYVRLRTGHKLKTDKEIRSRRTRPGPPSQRRSRHTGTC